MIEPGSLVSVVMPDGTMRTEVYQEQSEPTPVERTLRILHVDADTGEEMTPEQVDAWREKNQEYGRLSMEAAKRRWTMTMPKTAR